MKKHGVIMVFLLILALCLMGTVSASEDVDVDCDDTQMSFNQEEIQIDTVENEELDDLNPSSNSDENIDEINYENNTQNNSYDDINEINYENNLKNHSYESLYFTSTCELSDLKIKTVKLTKINDETTKNVFNKINDSPNGYVTYNDGNLLMLPLNERDLNIEKDESLIITFQNGTEKLQLSGNDGLTDNLWNDCQINGVVSWIISSSCDNSTITERPLSTGFISNQDNYPQHDLPLEKDMIGVSRDSDENAFIWYSENPDKKAFVIVDMVNKTTDEVLELNLDEDLEVLTSDEIKEIGVNASLKALDYFKSQGINIQKGYPYLYVLTTASVVKINETSTDKAIDGISEVLGLELNKNIFPIHNPLWKDLIFYYIWVDSTNNKDMSSYALKYDVKSSKLVVSDEARKQGDEIAYKMGLYGKYVPVPKPHYNGGCVAINKIINTENDNSTNNNTNVTNATTSTEKTINKTPEYSIAYSGNPFNVLYTLIAIMIVSTIFGIGYSKRDK